jgi:hypothetical protein
MPYGAALDRRLLEGLMAAVVRAGVRRPFWLHRLFQSLPQR